MHEPGGEEYKVPNFWFNGVVNVAVSTLYGAEVAIGVGIMEHNGRTTLIHVNIKGTGYPGPFTTYMVMTEEVGARILDIKPAVGKGGSLYTGIIGKIVNTFNYISFNVLTAIDMGTQFINEVMEGGAVEGQRISLYSPVVLGITYLLIQNIIPHVLGYL